MVVVVGRDADFASAHDGRAAALGGGLLDGEFAVDVEQAGGDGREVGKLVGDRAYVNADIASLSEGRDGGRKKEQEQTDADEIRLAGLHQYISPLWAVYTPANPAGQFTEQRAGGLRASRQFYFV
jgi:hypothetical protein